MRIEIPEFSLVALVGASSSGKSTFAKKHFLPTEILSSDFFRAMVSDDENDQNVSADAFDLLYTAAGKRLKNMKNVVIDATNFQKKTREDIIRLARNYDVHSAAIVLDIPEKILLERNNARGDRKLSDKVISRHAREVKLCIKNLKRDGFRFVYVIKSEEEADNAEIVRTKLWNNKKDEHGPFDIIGDIHGCFDELALLLSKLGYEKKGEYDYVHPDKRKAVFLGDLCDRGPKNVPVLKLAMNMVRSGNALAVPGNHDVKLLKYLGGGNVRVKNGLEETVSEISNESESFKNDVKDFIDSLIGHYVLDDGKLVVSHAGIKEEYIGRGSKRIRDFCLYGDVTGENDDDGLPVRLDWAADYRGKALNVFGHTPNLEVRSVNNTCDIDTACVFGGKLTALRYPEREYVSVPALKKYSEHPRRLITAHENIGDMLSYKDIGGKMFIETKLMPSITVAEENSAAALEIMSRFAADPHWLIYLPPTMSPCETSPLEEYLEHPAEAFSYYRRHGIKNVICEKKHMGSRAVIVLCHDGKTAENRFGVKGERGIIYTRTGRKFFDNDSVQNEILDRLDKVLTENNFWKSFDSEWVCLDTELLPWSEKAQGLIGEQYAPVGRAGRDGLANAVDALEKACKNLSVLSGESPAAGGETLDLHDLLERYRQKKYSLEKYTESYREYCWRVNSADDIRIAPFHLLACEGKVFSDQKHVWHMETLKKYCTGKDKIFIATDYVNVDTEDESSVLDGIKWWEDLTAGGGEGMVVKPEYFIAQNNSGLLQPAVKCRGREYLRIIYGPEYLFGENLQRLKKRSLARKRSLALREFSLGMESLERFVSKMPLYKVHECVFGVLAFESEPVDPRL